MTQESFRMDERPLLTSDDNDCEDYAEAKEPDQLTLRAVLVGLFIGTLICFSNCYFGLQTGWISMMSLPASLMGYGIFKAFENHTVVPFSKVENVLVQTIAVASGTMPLAAGLVGIIPAMEKLLKAGEGGPHLLSLPQLIGWSLGVAFFGVFFAVPLRKQVLIKEKLKFPSGKATAEMISVLHQKHGEESNPDVLRVNVGPTWAQKIGALQWSFFASSVYTFLTYFVPSIRSFAVFDWLSGNHFALQDTWLLSFQPSLAYAGQGIIMGPHTTLSMLLGAIIGWGILSPISKLKGWAPGPVDDYSEGARGWIIWISLAIMLTDSIVSLALVILRWSLQRQSAKEQQTAPNEFHTGETGLLPEPDADASPDALVPMSWTLVGLLLSTAACALSIKAVFGDLIPFYATLVSIILALLLSILGVRALGETDLNPVSGIGKISQLLFAVIIPRTNPNAILINLVAGGVAEAGAQQAGDLMQDLKTGHLLGASPRVQFYGQLIGSLYSAFLSAAVYKLYMSIYQIPGDLFRIPTAEIWIDCSRLVTGQGLPPHVQLPCIGFAIVFGVISCLKATKHTVQFVRYLPSGLAVSIGMYNTVDFTLARVLGGLAGWWWTRKCEREGRKEFNILIIIVASGFILGEGILSILNLAMAAASIPHR